MSKKHYLTVAVYFSLFSLSAQNQQVQDWSDANPSVLLIESADATPEFLENLDANNVQYIVYQQEVQFTDIAAFEAKSKPIDIDAIDQSDAAEIKVWLSEYQDVKIIKRSYYDQLDTTKQAIYDESNALILLGEDLTIEDIRNY